jgi:hypothetical protein
MANAEGTRFSGRDKLIVVGTILVVALAIFVIARVVMSDRPHPMNEAPKNVVGTSEKALSMKAEQAAHQQSAAPAAPVGGGGDDVEPPARK